MKRILCFLYSLLILLTTSCSFFNAYIINATFSNFTISDYGKIQDVAFFPSIGENNLLVVPLLFKDHSFKDDEILNIRNDLDIAFFGDSEDIDFESVSSYYYKSSYEKLIIKGEVSKSIVIDKTVEEIVSLTKDDNPYIGINSSYYDNSYYPINFAIDELKKDMDLSIYDNNKDGIIDGFYFIYLEETYQEYCLNHNINEEDEIFDKISSFLWAYSYFYVDEKDIFNPSLGAYSFSSYNFMYCNEVDVDAHIYIHETGHMLGLSDYYNYDFGLNDENNKKDLSMPIGGLDMMDLNVGDHNAYSKLLLGWINPIIVNSKYNNVINSFSISGEAILIPISSYNGSPFFSYLIIEYYTPTLLNTYDMNHKYINKYPNMFSLEGFKIYRVNAHLAYAKDNIEIINDFSNIDNSNDYIGFLTSNTPRKSMLKSYYGLNRAYNDRLLTLLSPINNNYFQVEDKFRFANNADLFVEGSNFIYNESNVEVIINFSALNENSGTINVEVKR